MLNLDSLYDRREMLCKMFAVKSAKNASMPFKQNYKLNHIQTKNTDKYNLKFCNTERLKKSALPQIERILNQLEKPQSKYF